MSCATKKNTESKTSYEISKNQVELILEDNKTRSVNELRLSTNHNSRDLQRFLFEEYGKWDSRLKSNASKEYLTWSNIKLLDDSDELFTVYAGSVKEKKVLPIKLNDKEKYYYIEYAAAILLDSNNKDYLATSPNKKYRIIDYLAIGANSVSKKNKAFKKALKSK